LLRYSISSETDQTVRLSDELKHTANYLFIQEQRFAGRCVVTVHADDGAGEARIPKFTLQPIIENAFEHGLQGKEGEWRLGVRAKVIGRRLVLMVKDGGVGMEPGKLKALRREIASGARPSSSASEAGKGRRGIGLANVHGRLTIRYGGRYGVRLFSTKG